MKLCWDWTLWHRYVYTYIFLILLATQILNTDHFWVSSLWIKDVQQSIIQQAFCLIANSKMWGQGDTWWWLFIVWWRLFHWIVKVIVSGMTEGFLCSLSSTAATTQSSQGCFWFEGPTPPAQNSAILSTQKQRGRSPTWKWSLLSVSDHVQQTCSLCLFHLIMENKIFIQQHHCSQNGVKWSISLPWNLCKYSTCSNYL